MRRVNISLDTLDPERFRQLTRTGDLGRVLEGVDAALEAGLAVKLNAVALKGVNEDEFVALTRFAHERGMDMTFIEVMPLGELDGLARIDQYLPLTKVRERLAQAFTLEDIDYRTGGPARYMRARETGGRVGFITPLTHNFCEVVQSRARHLHRDALYVPRPGGRRRPARAAARQRERRSAARGDRGGHRAKTQGP